MMDLKRMTEETFYKMIFHGLLAVKEQLEEEFTLKRLKGIIRRCDTLVTFELLIKYRFILPLEGGKFRFSRYLEILEGWD